MVWVVSIATQMKSTSQSSATRNPVVFDNSPATTAGRGPDRRELPQPVSRGPAVPVNQLDQSARAALRYAMALSQEATSFVRRIVLTL